MMIRLGVRLKTVAQELLAPAMGEFRSREAEAERFWQHLAYAGSDWPGHFLRYSNAYWQRDADDPEMTRYLDAQVAFEDAAAVNRFLAGIDRERVVAFGVDPRIAVADLWLPTGADGGVFGDRAAAHALIGAPIMADPACGEGVNVVIIDTGVDGDWVREFKAMKRAGQKRVNGWSRYDWVNGKKVWHNAGSSGVGRSPHARAIARNVLEIAPGATIWDVPLIGDGERPPSLSTATAMLNRIRAFKQRELFNGWIDKRPCDPDGRWARRQDRHAEVSNSVNQPWILVNAWGVFDTGPSLRGLGLHAGGDNDYADDRRHFLTEDVEGLEQAGIDVVFCAGNCGEPCPDSRCGPGECGPGRSILGLNGHPGVLTVGAVRVDGLPAGYSAEGPGRLLNGWTPAEQALKHRAMHKPDLCAPSNFHERGDASWLNLGTSAAAGIAAGILARLRSVPGAEALRPHEMREVLRESAVEMPGQRSPWDPRLGHGVIHLERALAELAKHPSFTPRVE